MDSQACLYNQQELRLGVLVDPSLEDGLCQGHCLWVWNTNQQILVYGCLSRHPAFRNESYSAQCATLCKSDIKMLHGILPGAKLSFKIIAEVVLL